MTIGPVTRIALTIVTALVLIFIYVPIALIFIYSFNSGTTPAWPPVGFTLEWWGEAIRNTGLQQAFLTSILVALCATLVALALGTVAALGVARYSFFGRESISFVVILPIALPGIVTGMALSTTFAQLGFPLGFLAIVVGHATFCVVIAYNNVIARLRRLPRTPEEASADLGADSFTTFRRITLPGIRTALLSGALLAFALSFDEIIVTNFTAGPGTQTIPMWILSAIRRPTELPVVNVVAFILILVSTIPVYLAQRISGAAGGGGRY